MSTEKPRRPPKDWESASEYGDLLAEVMDDQAKRAQRRGAFKPPRGSRMPATTAPVLAMVSLWLWVFPPTVLQPMPPPPVPVALQEAGLRVEMFLQLKRIQTYLAENGQLPDRLEDAGEVTKTVQYFPLVGSVFRLLGQANGVTVEYLSTQPTEELLTNAKDVITVGGRS